MSRGRVLAVGAVVTTAALGLGGLWSSRSAPRLPPSTPTAGCGLERAGVKHLTDGYKLPAQPVPMTVEQLIAMSPPPVTSRSRRFPVERQLVELRSVHLVAVKQEPDSDLHLIIATAAGAEVNVESPQGRCDQGSPYASKLAQARAALDRALPQVSTTGYTPLNMTATIDGVLFFDVLHGQRGAPNGVELHPVTSFKRG